MELTPSKSIQETFAPNLEVFWLWTGEPEGLHIAVSPTVMKLLPVAAE